MNYLAFAKRPVRGLALVVLVAASLLGPIFTSTAGAVGGPSVSFSYPSPCGCFVTYGNNWGGSITGTADASGDPGASVTSVQLEIYIQGGNFWDGASFSSASPVQVLASGTTNWSYSLPAADLTAGYTYNVIAEVTDSNSETALNQVDMSFTYDTTAPAGAVTGPVNGTTYGYDWPSAITGTSAVNGLISNADNRTIASVGVKIIDTTSGTYWDGAGFTSGAPAFVLSNLSTPNSVSTNWSLSLPYAQLNPGDNYSVSIEVTDSAGNVTDSTATLFTFESAPTISSAGITGTPQVGQTLTAVSSGVTGIPAPVESYQWYSNGSPVGSNSQTYSVQPSDAGNSITVTITETNPVTSVSATSSGTSSIAAAPGISSASISGTPRVGQTLSASATGVTGSPSPTTSYQWYSNGSLVGSNSQTYIVQPSDAGNSITVTITETNSVSSASATSSGTTNVTQAPGISNASITGTPKVGQTLSAVSSGVTGAPAPSESYQWYSNGSPVGSNSSTYVVQPSDAGNSITLTITETNSVSSVSATSVGTASVTEAPSIASAGISGTALVGQTLSANATGVTGSPSPTVSYQWYSSGSPVGSNSQTYVVQPSDAGKSVTVTITETNSVSSATATSPHVTPTGPPGAPNSVAAATSGAAAVTITWSQPSSLGGLPVAGYSVLYSANGGVTWTLASSGIGGSSTSYTIGNLVGGTNYVFEVLAFNADGTGPATISNQVMAVDVPGTPTGLSAVDLVTTPTGQDTTGAGTVTVSWTAPSSHGSPITGYTITSSPGGLTCLAGATATSCVVHGLTDGTSYTFTVTATNAVGTGLGGTSGAATPTGPPGIPGAVLTAGQDGTVLVSWQAPTNNGGVPITTYTVTASPGGAQCSTPTLNCTVKGLTNGTSYTFTVTATNSVGVGPGGISVVTIPAGAAGAAGNVVATLIGNTATITWTPAAGNGGVVTYKVTSSPASKGCTTSGLTCTITKLAWRTTYTFSVVATNVTGSGPGASSHPVTTATAPGAVSSVMVKAGNGAVTVSWQVPLSIGGAPVTSYKVTSSPGAKTCTTSATSCTVSGLSDGATYTFFVVAVNAAGAGPRTTSRAVRVSVRPPQYYIGPFRAGSSTLSAAQEIRIVSIGLAIVRGHYRSVVVSGYAAASSTLAHQRAAVVGAYLVTVLHSMRATAGQLHRWGLSNPLVITIYQTRNSTLTQGAGVTLVK